MFWTAVTLHDYTLMHQADELRAEFGLFTRVSATTPLKRAQALTVQEGPLHRLFGRVSVRLQTVAVATVEGGERPMRENVAPLLRRTALPAFIDRIFPNTHPGEGAWRPAHRRAFRRAVIVPSRAMDDALSAGDLSSSVTGACPARLPARLGGVERAARGAGHRLANHGRCRVLQEWMDLEADDRREDGAHPGRVTARIAVRSPPSDGVGPCGHAGRQGSAASDAHSLRTSRRGCRFGERALPARGASAVQRVTAVSRGRTVCRRLIRSRACHRRRPGRP